MYPDDTTRINEADAHAGANEDQLIIIDGAARREYFSEPFTPHSEDKSGLFERIKRWLH